MLILTKSQTESLKRATEGMGNDAATEYRLMFINLLIFLGAAYVEYIGPCDWWDGEPVSGKPERCIAK